MDLKKAEENLKRKDVVISKLQTAKVESDEAIQTLTAELEVAQKEREREVEQLREHIVEQQGVIDQSWIKIDQLMVGEGLDMEAFIDSNAFAEIKDCIEDSTGDELIRRIKEVHPDLDLSFLSAGGSSSPKVRLVIEKLTRMILVRWKSSERLSNLTMSIHPPSILIRTARFFDEDPF